MQGKDYEFAETHAVIYDGFTSFLKWSVISVIVILALMAFFLL